MFYKLQAWEEEPTSMCIITLNLIGKVFRVALPCIVHGNGLPAMLLVILWFHKMTGLIPRVHYHNAGFAKTFCPSLVILSDEAGVLRQTFWVFISHFTLKMAGK